MTVEQVARVCHEANKGYCEAIGDTSQVTWESASPWQRACAVAGVTAMLSFGGPEQSYELWRAARARDGWVFGPVYDDVAKTDPRLMPYADLPEAQRRKDALFAAVMSALLD